MKVTQAVQGLLLVALLALLDSVSAGYDVGDLGAICWRKNTTSNENAKVPCPPGFNIVIDDIQDSNGVTVDGVAERLSEEDPNSKIELVSGREYSFKFTFQVNMTSHDILNVGEVAIPHANVHSCLSSVGFCTPFIANTPGLSTHSSGMKGNFTQGAVSMVSLVSITTETEVSYTMIAHGRTHATEDGTKMQWNLAFGITGVTIIPEAKVLKVTADAQTIGLVFVVVAEVFLVGCLAYILAYWSNRVIRFSQPRFMIAIIVCGVWAVAGVLTLSGSAEGESLTDGNCALRPWMTYLPVTLMYSLLLAKTFRVWRVMHNPSLRRVRATETGAFIHALILTAPMVGILALNAAANNPVAKTVPQYPSEKINMLEVCSGSDDDVWTGLAIAYFALLLAAGAVMARRTSGFTVLFNESKSISFGIQNLVLLAGVLLPVQFATASDPSTLYLVRALGVSVAVMMAVGSLIVPKIQLVASGIQFGKLGEATTKAGVTQVSGAITKNTVKSAKSTRSTRDENPAVACNIKGGSMPSDAVDCLQSALDNLNKLLDDQNAGLAVKQADVVESSKQARIIADMLGGATFPGNDNV